MIYLREIRCAEVPETSYIARIPAVRQLAREGGLRFTKPVTFLVGENGSGKSTLLEAVACLMGFNPEGGSRDYSFSTRDTHSELSEYLRAIKSRSPKDGYFLRAESFYNVASYLDESGSAMRRYGGASLHGQSHGESFIALAMNRFEGNGLYILDEPEAALSPRRLLTLAAVIGDLVKRDSQFIIATHSPVLTAFPDAQILQLSDSGIAAVEYRETDSYIIMKDFLESPERMMRYLLNDAEETSIET